MNITETIREDISSDIVDDAALVDLVCSSTHNLFKELLRLLEADDDFSEIFLEKTKSSGRRISVQVHPVAEEPFCRINEDAVCPTLELYLPVVKRTADVANIPISCGQDLLAAFSGQNGRDPLEKYSGDKAFLPRLKDLPRPALALSQGPIYIRIIETIIDGNKESFDIEGYPPVITLINQYIFKHSNHPYHMNLTIWSREHRLGKGVSVLRVMDSDTHFHTSPLVVVGLLEGSLGFTRVGEPVAVGTKLVWLFQREKPLLQLWGSIAVQCAEIARRFRTFTDIEGMLGTYIATS